MNRSMTKTDQCILDDYVKERNILDMRKDSSSASLWFLRFLNFVFRTSFTEGSEDYLTLYEKDRKKAKIFATLTPLNKIAVGLKLGQFSVAYNSSFGGKEYPHHIQFRYWSDYQKSSYETFWTNQNKKKRQSVLSGPIMGDISKDEITDHEWAELTEIRRLRAEVGPNEHTVIYWSSKDFPDRMVRKRT